MADKWTPATIEAWNRIAQDVGITIIGLFLFVYGALEVREAGQLAVMFAAGGALLGIPAGRRFERKLRNGDTPDE